MNAITSTLSTIISVSIPTWLYLAMSLSLAYSCATFLLKAIDRIERPSKRKDV